MCSRLRRCPRRRCGWWTVVVVEDGVVLYGREFL